MHAAANREKAGVSASEAPASASGTGNAARKK